jgi:uncharacterized DUF497 family protein
MEFEWSPEKARANLRKHRVSFEEATTVFNRHVHQRASVHVAFADRGERIRIINARKVTKRERELYEKEER